MVVVGHEGEPREKVSSRSSAAIVEGERMDFVDAEGKVEVVGLERGPGEKGSSLS